MGNTLTKVLIVDDNEPIRGLLAVLFKSEGFDVVGELSSGDNFINAFKRLMPDIICLDQEMPGKDGLTLLKELREIDQRSTVLMITGTTDPEFQQLAVSVGVAGFLRKPFSQAQILKELKQVDHARKLLSNAFNPYPNGPGPDAVSVVIADDSSIMRNLLSIVLKSIGIDVVGEALDGQEAVAMADQHQPAAICLDLEMPNMSGIEALEKIKAAHPEMKVIIISGHADRDKVKRAIELGACGFIVKPFEAQQVIQTAKKLLF